MKRICISGFLLLLSSLFAYPQLPKLMVTSSRRFIKTDEGKPFFWQGDTAWELFHRLTKEETQQYFEKRASQGFNVVQAVALAEIDGLNTPNALGELPFVNLNSLKPNEAYFDHIDWVIDKAAEFGIYIALLPTWGDKLFKNSWGVGPEVFNPPNAKTFGQYMGQKFKYKTNVIWILGGDRNPRENSEDVEVWQQMAAGIQQGTGQATLMSFHPQPASPGGSSNWFHQDRWLDFNMHQTGHCPNEPTYRKILHDYHLSPMKPVIDGEPLYEDHPNCFNAREQGYSNPQDIRRIMYWNVFAGAFGQTYGCHDVWQMYDLDKTGINGPLRPWHVALDLPVANQVKHLKNLIMSRDFFSRIPALEMVLTEQEDDNSFVIATRDSGGKYAMIYFPTYKEVTLDLAILKAKKIQGTWYDPRTGASFPGFVTKPMEHLKVRPPVKENVDWVLVLDAVGANYPKPGNHLPRD